VNTAGENPGKGKGISTPLWREKFYGDNSYDLHSSLHNHSEERNTVRREGIGHSIHLLPHFHRYYYY